MARTGERMGRFSRRDIRCSIKRKNCFVCRSVHVSVCLHLSRFNWGISEGDQFMYLHRSFKFLRQKCIVADVDLGYEVSCYVLAADVNYLLVEVPYKVLLFSGVQRNCRGDLFFMREGRQQTSALVDKS